MVLCVSLTVFSLLFICIWEHGQTNETTQTGAKRRMDELNDELPELSIHCMFTVYDSVQFSPPVSAVGCCPEIAFTTEKIRESKYNNASISVIQIQTLFFLLDSISLRNTRKKHKNKIIYTKSVKLYQNKEITKFITTRRRRKKIHENSTYFFGWKHKNKNKFSRVFECSNKTKLPFPITITFTFTFTFTLYIVQYPHPSYFFPAKVNRIWLTVVLGRKAKKKKTNKKYKKFSHQKLRLSESVNQSKIDSEFKVQQVLIVVLVLALVLSFYLVSNEWINEWVLVVVLLLQYQRHQRNLEIRKIRTLSSKKVQR